MFTVKSIGIIGGGVVGKATARTYLEYCEVRVYDMQKERRTHPIFSSNPGEAVLDCDLVFICLPEVSIASFMNDLLTGGGVYEDRVKKRNYVIKSTIPIGTTRKLAEKYQLPNLVHSPEFLTSRCSITDSQLPARNIIGYPYRPATLGYDSKCYDLLYRLYEERFPGTPILNLSSDESEAVKLMTNSFFAVKVAFFNEINALCEKLELSWSAVLRGILSDGRIGGSHTKVPGPDGKYGFGGACLPKDLEHLVNCIREQDDQGLHATVLDAAFIRNAADRARRIS